MCVCVCVCCIHACARGRIHIHKHICKITLPLLFIRPLSEKCPVACHPVLLFRYFQSRMKKGQVLRSSLNFSNLAGNRKDAHTRLPLRLLYTITHITPGPRDKLGRGKVFADVPGTVSKVSSGSGCDAVTGPPGNQGNRYLPRLARAPPYSRLRLRRPSGSDGSGVWFAQP